jgi:DNA-binding transcriptional MocR family regulator
VAAHDRLEAALRRDTAELAPGSRLPSVRELSRRHRVSPVTVGAAISRLCAEGLVVARPGHGTFVAERRPGGQGASDFSWQPVALGPAIIDSNRLELLIRDGGEDTIPLASGFPDEGVLPLRELTAATIRASRRPGAWARPPSDGVEELRAWFARDAGGLVRPADVTVTSGAQAALATAMRALGRRGEPIVVESPTYLGGLAAARGAGLVPVPVPVDGDGVRTDLLAQTLERSGARLMLLQPTYANPHGSVLSDERRDEVLDLAQRHGVFVIEDDWVRDLWLDGTPPPAPLVARDRHGHVIYIRSLTKATAASLRIAGVSARGPVSERLRRARLLDDFFISGVLQHAAIEVVSGPGWARHLRRLRTVLRSRRDALIDALGHELPDWQVFQRPPGGLGLWVGLPDHIDETWLVERAAAVGVLVMPGAPSFPAEPSGPFLRLSFGGTDEERLVEGVRRLARVTRGR